MFSWQFPKRSIHHTSPWMAPPSSWRGSETRPGTRPAESTSAPGAPASTPAAAAAAAGGTGRGRARAGGRWLGGGEAQGQQRSAEDGGGRREDPVVGPGEGPLPAFYRHEASVGADAGVHDTQDDAAVREVLRGSDER